MKIPIDQVSKAPFRSFEAIQQSQPSFVKDFNAGLGNVQSYGISPDQPNIYTVSNIKAGHQGGEFSGGPRSMVQVMLDGNHYNIKTTLSDDHGVQNVDFIDRNNNKMFDAGDSLSIERAQIPGQFEEKSWSYLPQFLNGVEGKLNNQEKFTQGVEKTPVNFFHDVFYPKRKKTSH